MSPMPKKIKGQFSISMVELDMEEAICCNLCAICGLVSGSDFQSYRPILEGNFLSRRTDFLEFSRKNSMSISRPFISRTNRRFSTGCSNQFLGDYMNVEGTSAKSPSIEISSPSPNDGTDILTSNDSNNIETPLSGPKMFRNRFLNFVRIGSVLDNAAESFFKSEIRRRLFVTAVLIVISRVGYFIPLPGFDRRLIPQDYLSFASGSVGKLLLMNLVSTMCIVFSVFKFC